MVSLDEEAYGVHFGDKTWTFMQSDGIVKELKPDGDGSVVLFTDREEYCNMVKQQRMAECDLQASHVIYFYCFTRSLDHTI